MNILRIEKINPTMKQLNNNDRTTERIIESFIVSFFSSISIVSRGKADENEDGNSLI